MHRDSSRMGIDSLAKSRDPVNPVAHSPAAAGNGSPFGCSEPGGGRVSVRRWLLGSVICGLALLLVARLVMLQGWLRPVQIAGGSMAESFYGPGFEVTCQDCRFTLRLGIEYPPVDGRAVCPNCGFTNRGLDLSLPRPGQQVIIDRWPLVCRDPRPWEPIAFRMHGKPQQFAVKRVVAGHSGRVAVRDGDLFLDGKIVRKSLAQLRAMRIPVYDDRFRSQLEANLPARWQAQRTSSHWKPTASGYRYDGRSNRGTGGVDWLRYDQWICWPNVAPPRPRTTSVPILDHYAYNHELSRGQLHRVRDMMLSCQIETEGSGYLVVRVENMTDRFDYRWSVPENHWHLSHNGRVVREGTEPGRGRSFRLELAICDQRLFVAIDSVTVISYLYPLQTRSQRTIGPVLDGQRNTSDEAREQEKKQPTLAFGADGLQVQLSRIRIDRDVYCLGPGGAERWMAASDLQPGEWFVLGDNVPISFDSRYGMTVRREEMLGIVTARDQWRLLAW